MFSHRTRSCAVFAAASAVASLLTTSAFAGDTAGASTVSISGSTAMRNFTVSPEFTALTPGTSIQVGGLTYTAALTSGGFNIVQVQLASNDATNFTSYSSAAQTNANFLAYRVEWHEQGSVEGINELANDQIGPVLSVDPSSRNPVTPVGGIGNRIYINRNIFTGPATTSGFTLNSSTYNTYTNYTTSGSNTQGGQNRVQMAISDVRAVQGFSVGGTSAFNRTAGSAGYGKGNPALGLASNTDLLGLGTASARRQLVDQTSLNMGTDKVDPRTGTNYAAGAWNTAGIDNTTSQVVASTATTFAANPGTGLTDLNKSDARWLQATGRLANGADFNVTTRDVNSGTLNVAASNVGLDPSYAVGENDSGNGLNTAVDQTVVGSNIRFTGKSSGGQLRATVQNSRMAIGHLSLNDIKSGNAAGTVASPNAGAAPLRALGVRNSDDNSATAVQPSLDTISNGSYLLSQNENYVTIKDPTNGAAAITAYQAAHPGTSDAAAWAALTDAQTGIKGDTSVHTETVNGTSAQVGDVAALRNNILNSNASFPVGAGLLNPTIGLLKNSFVPTKYMSFVKAGDGLTPVANPNFDSTNYAAVKSAYGSNFEVGDAASVTTGTGSTYGTGANAIAITSSNYLFGDFNGDGKRDFQDLKYAQAGQAMLGTANTDYTTGGNSTLAYNTFTKGDLIVKGDYNSDGKFDGRDLYALAHGAALADAGKTSDQLANPDNAQLTSVSGTNVSDRYRAGTLYKNAALDYLQANATAAQKQQATANATNDPTGANAFNKFDVNRDGKVDRQDAAIVDGAVGKDYRNLNDQLNSVVATNINAAGTVFVGDPTVDQTTPRKSFNLVDAELNDDGAISYGTDFKLIHDNLGSSLLDGDANFDGSVNFNDFLLLQANFGLASTKFSQGNFNFDGVTNFNDFLLLQANFGLNANGTFTPLTAQQSAEVSAWAAAVPEPTSLALFGLGAMVTLRRRRSR